jgi:hypothetical protein
MKFDKNLYEGLIERSLMTVKKSNENLRALTLNEKVGENYSLTSSVGDMLQHLKRRRDACLVMMYKIFHDKVAVS